MKAAILGASGYIGGELARLLIGHSQIELQQVTSDRLAGQPLSTAHPNLYGQTKLVFSPHEKLAACDILFLTLPHGKAMEGLSGLLQLAPRIIDLSADFRLRQATDYITYYGQTHPQKEWLQHFVPGIPELYRDKLRTASYISIPGCMANAGILALYPLAQEGLITGQVVVDGLTGSSGSGLEQRQANVHAERSGVMRVFKAVDHRHQAEIAQFCGVPISMSAIAVEAVRGVQVLCHVELAERLTEKALWSIYRKYYAKEPFIRLVKRHSGLYRLPEPKILAGSNYCDIGFTLAANQRSLVMVSALDNLVKGGAGNAVQCLNISAGWDERDGLGFFGLHPI